MKKNWDLGIVLLIGILQVACSNNNEINGKWESRDEENIKIYDLIDGKFLFEEHYESDIISIKRGTYNVSRTVITFSEEEIQVNGEWKDIITVFGASAPYRVKIINNNNNISFDLGQDIYVKQ